MNRNASILLTCGFLSFAGWTFAQTSNDDWMKNKLQQLSSAEIVPDWTIEDGETYVVNGAPHVATFLNKNHILLARVEEPEPQVRIINQFSLRPEILAIGKDLGIPPSTIAGWGIVTSLNSGLCGGDGWEDEIGRDKAMILANATSSLTRFEYSITGSNGIRDNDGGMWGRVMSWGWEDPAEFDGWLVFDVETWNMVLMARSPELPDIGTGYVWERPTDTVTLFKHYPKWGNISNLDEKLAAHPYGVDTNGDSKNDALRFTRDDVIKEHIRIIHKMKEVFPKAKWSAYNFPNMGYWTSDKEEVLNMRNWEDAIEQLHDAGVLDSMAMSIYDHYSHLFRFPEMTDAQWKRAQKDARARDIERFSRGVTNSLSIGDRLGMPVWLYTWDVFHNDGRCSKAGWVIPWEEFEDHIRTLASLRSAYGVQVAGFYQWGARRFYWDNDSCSRTNMEKYIGTSDEEFEAYDLQRAAQIMVSVHRLSQEIWGGSNIPPTSLSSFE